LAIADRSGTVQVWDLAHHRRTWQLAAKPYALAFSTDGTRLAIADQDAIRICEAETGRECGRLRGHNGTVRSLDWLPGSHRLASASNDQTVRLWDADTGQELRVYRGHTAPVLCVACSPDGRHLASGDAAGLVKIWDAAQDQRAAVLAETPEAAALRFDPSGQQLRVAKVSGGKFGGVRTFDLGSGTIVADHTVDLVRRVEWPLRYVDFSPDGRFLAGPTGSDPKCVGQWDASTGRLLTTVRGHAAEVRVVAFSPSGRQLATAAWNRKPNQEGEFALWEGEEDGRVTPVWLVATPSPVDCLTFSPDGRYLVVGDRGDRPPEPDRAVDGRLVVWDTRTRQPLLAWSAHAGRVQAVAVSPDGKTVVSVGREPGAGLRIWDADSGRLRHDLPAPPRATVVRFSPDGTRLAVAGYEGTVQLWDPLTGQDILTLRGPVGQITESEANDTDVVFSPDGTRLAVNCWTKAIHVFRAEPAGPDPRSQ
jgi:WD40 repeat protein